MRAATITLLCGALALGLSAPAARAAHRRARAPAEAVAPAPADVAAPGPADAATPGPTGEAAPAYLVETDPSPAAFAAPEPPDTTFLVRGGYFGVPDVIADSLFRMHPKVDGYAYGAEFRYHGHGGVRSVGSVGLAVDRATTKADGLWQTDEFDEPWAASGKIDMTAVTITAYANIFPSWPVHPYVGFGLGAAYVSGSYRKNDDVVNVDAWFPAVHIPVGLALELGDRFLLAAEARFIDGITAGGALAVRF